MPMSFPGSTVVRSVATLVISSTSLPYQSIFLLVVNQRGAECFVSALGIARGIDEDHVVGKEVSESAIFRALEQVGLLLSESARSHAGMGT